MHTKYVSRLVRWLKTDDEGEPILICPESQMKELENIWASAFMIFSSIYLQKNPMRSQELLKYMSVVRMLASRVSLIGFKEGFFLTLPCPTRSR